MTTVSSICEKCGAKIPADARQGVCPACQLETGLGLLAEEGQPSNAQRPTSNSEVKGALRVPQGLSRILVTTKFEKKLAVAVRASYTGRGKKV